VVLLRAIADTAPRAFFIVPSGTANPAFRASSKKCVAYTVDQGFTYASPGQTANEPS
jgi:hypothetical protein